MRALLLFAVFVSACPNPVSRAWAQGGPGGPPNVGVVKVERRPIIESTEFVGRVQAIDRVDLVPRVTAFLEQRLFAEGQEVDKGQVLYRLERGPFEADVQAKAAQVAQANALLRNATITLGRATSLLNTPAGQRSSVDDAQAQQGSQAAQVALAQAQLKSSQISLDYTEIRAPVAGKITRTVLTEGNVVSPSVGALATIVSQDPMYVLFPVSVRTAIELRKKYSTKGGLSAVQVKVRLPDGRIYEHAGKLDYVDPTVSANTDTLTFRAQVPNPAISGVSPGGPGNRELVDGEFITAIVEAVDATPALAIPRQSILSDQQGNYVLLVGADNKVQQRRLSLGQSTPDTAVVMDGLKEGDTVIVEGIGLPSVRPGVEVHPTPLGAPPAGAAPSNAPKPAGS